MLTFHMKQIILAPFQCPVRNGHLCLIPDNPLTGHGYTAREVPKGADVGHAVRAGHLPHTDVGRHSAVDVTIRHATDKTNVIMGHVAPVTTAEATSLSALSCNQIYIPSSL